MGTAALQVPRHLCAPQSEVPAVECQVCAPVPICATVAFERPSPSCSAVGASGVEMPTTVAMGRKAVARRAFVSRLARPAPVTGSAPAPGASSEDGADAEELPGTWRRCQLRFGLNTRQGAEGLSRDTADDDGDA